MVKAVFFDWSNTLARYKPTREELHSQVLREFGIELPPEKIMPSLLVADRDYLAENARSPVLKRSPEEQLKVYTLYQNTVLAGAGIKVAPDILLRILKRMEQSYDGITFALFEDVLPLLKTLKERKFILGLLTNLDTSVDRDVKRICSELGLEPYLDFVVTSGEVGVDKPKPPIFLAALQRTGVDASEAVHVGDQYDLDVIGARGVGITPVLLDRYDFYPEVSDCLRIHSLTELPEYL